MNGITLFEAGRAYIGGTLMDKTVMVTQRAGCYVTLRGDLAGKHRISTLITDRGMEEMVTGGPDMTFLSCDVKEAA